jgi:hypothetical protein
MYIGYSMFLAAVFLIEIDALTEPQIAFLLVFDFDFGAYL